MKVYIAAPYPLKADAIAVMKVLEHCAHTVTSRWLKTPELADAGEHAQKDLDDVASADVLVALHPSGWEDKGTGGRHVEFGYAIAVGVKIILIGKRSNTFHYLSDVVVIESDADLLQALEDLCSF